MIRLFKKLNKKFVLGLFTFLVSSVFIGSLSFSKAADDLLWQITQPAYDYDIIIGGLGENVKTVGDKFFKGSTEIAAGISVYVKNPIKDTAGNLVCRWGACPDACLSVSTTNQRLCQRHWKMQSSISLSASAGIKSKPSTVVRITRMLLIMVIALSITMILYNGMMYIVETGQGKEGKSLKNLAYIIAGILIALFSVIIIRVIESITSTIADLEELPQYGYEQDKEAVSRNERGAEVGVDFRF